jgi:dethiobiotin synthetase
LTIAALRARGVAVHGMAFVGDANEDNEMTIAELGQVRRLGRLPLMPEVTREHLAAAFAAGFALADFA